MVEKGRRRKSGQVIPLPGSERPRAAVSQPVAEPALGLPDDRILGEISHEVGNYFHKLYYWTDYLKNNHSSGGETAAVEMLEETVGRLERFMRMMLEYLAPARVSFSRVEAGDLLAGLADKLPGRSVDVVGPDGWRRRKVLVDPSLMAHAVRTIFERVAGTLLDEDTLKVGIAEAERREFRGLEFEFRAGAGLGANERLKKGIEMAVAEKFILMHGGELIERLEPPRGLIIFLPIYE